jgi:hypothetical protein
MSFYLLAKVSSLNDEVNALKKGNQTYLNTMIWQENKLSNCYNKR